MKWTIRVELTPDGKTNHLRHLHDHRVERPFTWSTIRADWAALDIDFASESEVEDLSVEIATEQLRRFGQLFRRNSREVAVDDPLIIADQPFDSLR